MLNQLQGRLELIKGKIKEAYGKLTDDEVALYNGKQDQFFGKLQEKYGITRQEAEERINRFDDESCCTTHTIEEDEHA